MLSLSALFSAYSASLRFAETTKSKRRGGECAEGFTELVELTAVIFLPLISLIY
jgi:hypothetical protein